MSSSDASREVNTTAFFLLSSNVTLQRWRRSLPSRLQIQQTLCGDQLLHIHHGRQFRAALSRLTEVGGQRGGGGLQQCTVTEQTAWPTDLQTAEGRRSVTFTLLHSSEVRFWLLSVLFFVYNTFVLWFCSRSQNSYSLSPDNLLIIVKFMVLEMFN